MAINLQIKLKVMKILTRIYLKIRIQPMKKLKKHMPTAKVKSQQLEMISLRKIKSPLEKVKAKLLKAVKINY